MNNIRNSLMSIADKILLKKRALIETVNDELKNIAQIEPPPIINYQMQFKSKEPSHRAFSTFCKSFKCFMNQNLKDKKKRYCNKPNCMSDAEIMGILILFHLGAAVSSIQTMNLCNFRL